MGYIPSTNFTLYTNKNNKEREKMIIDAKDISPDKIMTVEHVIKERYHKFGDVTSVLIINASNSRANNAYVEKKFKALDNWGIRCNVVHFEEDVTTTDLIKYITSKQDYYTAVMVQKPVYDHVNFDELVKTINPKKDIDGLHPYNQGMVNTDPLDAIVPCTAVGVINIMNLHNIHMRGQNVVIVGRGPLVADPLAKILEHSGATVTKIHTDTPEEMKKLLIKNANIIIPCAGRDLSYMINPETVGEELRAILGVGFRYENGKQLQDFDIHADWQPDVKITNNVNATGLATVSALVSNLVKIKLDEIKY